MIHVTDADYLTDSGMQYDPVDFEVRECPMCHGDAFSMGCLGNLRHYRCGDCGIDFSSSNR